MKTIQEIFKFCSERYLKNSHVAEEIKKVILSIIYCRTEKMKRRLKSCDDCGYEEYTYCSCRNRNCPKCLTYAKEKWIDSRIQEILNTRYFHTVFTVPHELNEIILNNQKVMYNILFRSVSETLTDLGKDKNHLGAQIGATMVLHTWDQKLLPHNHIHAIIPGGGLSFDGKWVNCKKKIFIHVKVLAKVFRGKFIEKLKTAYNAGELVFPKEMEYLYNKGDFKDLIDNLSKKNWYVYSKKTFSGPRAVIEYLGRYTHKIAISNSRIVDFKDGKVTFKWRDNKDGGKEKEMTVSASEFVRRYLLHVLPTGFMKIRHIGFIGNRNKKTKLKLCQKLTNTQTEQLKKSRDDILLKMTNGLIFKCPSCGGNNFHLVSIVKPIVADTS
jgi:Putative transposase/Transposase zinc-binding domain